jgi:hypothetical protein
VLSFQATKAFSPGLEPRTTFRGFGLPSCNLPAITKNIVHSAVLVSRQVSELYKPPSPGLEPRTVSPGCGICFCNLFFKTNNSDLRAVLLSVLSFRATGTTLTGNQTWDILWAMSHRPDYGGCKHL